MTAQNNTQRMMDAFKRAQADIASLADWIELELDRSDMDAEQGSVKWDHVDALVKVRHRLIETLSFFSGVKPKEIRRNLDELHM